MFRNRIVWEGDVCLSWVKIKAGMRTSYRYLKGSYKDYRGRLLLAGPGSPDMGQKPPERGRFRVDVKRMVEQTGGRLVREHRCRATVLEGFEVLQGKVVSEMTWCSCQLLLVEEAGAAALHKSLTISVLMSL